MPSIPKAISLGLALIIVFLNTVSSADFCRLGSVKIDGDVYCQPVQAIQYSNISTPGSYQRIVSMNNDGSCTSSPRPFSGPLAPLDEEVSVHFRGPVQLKQFAVYVPPAAASMIGQVPERRRYLPTHTAYVPSPGHILEQLMGEVVSGKVGEREATLFRDFLSIIGTGTTATSSAAPVEVTATIDNKVVSWINNWFGKLNTASSTAPAEVTATIDGNVVSWVNHWLGRATSTSDSAPAPVTTEKSNIGISTINACPAPTKAPTVKSSSAAAPIPDPVLSSYKRIGSYDAASQTVDDLVFLGNHGGGGSGVFDHIFGSSISYVSSDGTDGAPSPQILADTIIPSDTEVIIMSGRKCQRDCGFVRPNSVAYHGFAGADKIFLFEFSMPIDEKPGFNGDMPSIWLLNAQIPRTIEYGPGACSCWASGCGELDIVEALSTGSLYLKSTLHTNIGGGVADYILRPTHKTMKLAVIFNSTTASITIQVLPDDAKFPTMLSAKQVSGWRGAGGGRVSELEIK